MELRGLKVPRFVEEKTWAVAREESICRTLFDSPAEALAMTRRIDELPEADPWYVAHGRDMVEILRIGLRHTLGEIQASVGVEKVRRMLRAAMTPGDLQATKLWADMRTWEATNRPYMVLAN